MKRLLFSASFLLIGGSLVLTGCKGEVGDIANLTASASTDGQDLILSWDAAENASNYIITDPDGNQIATTSETSYTLKGSDGVYSKVCVEPEGGNRSCVNLIPTTLSDVTVYDTAGPQPSWVYIDFAGPTVQAVTQEQVDPDGKSNEAYFVYFGGQFTDVSKTTGVGKEADYHTYISTSPASGSLAPTTGYSDIVDAASGDFWIWFDKGNDWQTSKKTEGDYFGLLTVTISGSQATLTIKIQDQVPGLAWLP